MNLLGIVCVQSHVVSLEAQAVQGVLAVLMYMVHGRFAHSNRAALSRG